VEMKNEAIIECVPNFSEGQDVARVKQIVAAMRVDDVHLLDWSLDAAHNRSGCLGWLSCPNVAGAQPRRGRAEGKRRATRVQAPPAADVTHTDACGAPPRSTNRAA